MLVIIWTKGSGICSQFSLYNTYKYNYLLHYQLTFLFLNPRTWDVGTYFRSHEKFKWVGIYNDLNKFNTHSTLMTAVTGLIEEVHNY